jgi:hypothetical protein
MRVVGVAVLGLLVPSARTLLAQQQVVAGAQEVAVVDQGLWVSWQAEGAGHTESNRVIQATGSGLAFFPNKEVFHSGRVAWSRWGSM